MKIKCLLFGHKWKNVERHFYAEQGFSNQFTEHWQIERYCERCGKKENPEWFDKSWRIEHPIISIPFLEIDWPAYFNVEEYEAYKKTLDRINNSAKA